jgi:hypothetical protein
MTGDRAVNDRTGARAAGGNKAGFIGVGNMGGAIIKGL